MDGVTQPVSSSAGGPSDTTSWNDSDLRNSFSEDLDQQRSIVKQKEAELKEMQEQIESYNQMVKQLTSQREMAVKKLADMDSQIEELSKTLETERIQVEAKDKELKTKRTQLQTLKNEENELKDLFNARKQELDVAAESLANTQMNETLINTKKTELQQFLSMTNTALDDIEKAIDIKDTIKLSALCNQMLTPPPLSINTLLTNGMKPVSPVLRQNFDQQQQPQPQTTNTTNDNNDPFDSSTNFDPFADEDPFDGDDPFKSEDANLALPDDDPFNPSSSAASSGFSAVQQNDPFAPQASSRGGF